MDDIQVNRRLTPDERLARKDFYTLFWRNIFLRASQEKASDIHVKSLKTGLHVSLRVGGYLSDITKDISGETITSPDEMAEYVDNLKSVAGLNMGVKDKRQDSSFRLKMTNASYRINLSPGHIYGENIVMRIIYDDDIPTLPLLGLEEDILSDYRWALRQSQGFILITGPTGSGKSTTLQAGIREIADGKINVLAIEDPPERLMDNVVHEKITESYSWSEAVKGAMRQDPDVVLVGEIRDNESAKLSVELARTGHLVLSTLHTNDVPSTVERFLQLGVERHLIADAFRFISAQRLLKKLCDQCKIPALTGYFRLNIAGCPNCRQTGTKGRVPVIEYMINPDPDLIFSFNKEAFRANLKRSLASETLRLAQLGLIDYQIIEDFTYGGLHFKHGA